MKREMGGYLPFEMHPGKDFFSEIDESYILRTNSAKSAITAAIQSLKPDHIYVPYYCCSGVTHEILNQGVNVIYYHLTPDLLPEIDHIEPNSAVHLINYFGMMHDRVVQYAETVETVILDQSHSFFSHPVMRPGVYNIYSCRKFFGVPDGGYLVSLDCPHPELSPYRVSDHFEYLVRSSEFGQQSAYSDYQRANAALNGVYAAMSDMTASMMRTVDYRFVAARRRENFNVLHEHLSKYNRFDLSHIENPLYLYPLWLSTGIREALVREKIYAPLLWSDLLADSFQGSIEFDLSDNIAFLPLDQRYTPDDMLYLTGVVEECIRQKEIQYVCP